MSLQFPQILFYPGGVETPIPEIRPYLHFWRAKSGSCLTTASLCFSSLALFTLPLDVTIYNVEPQLAWPRTKAQLTKSSPKVLDLLEPAPKLLSPFLTNPLCGTALTINFLWLLLCFAPDCSFYYRCCSSGNRQGSGVLYRSLDITKHWLTLSLRGFPMLFWIQVVVSSPASVLCSGIKFAGAFDRCAFAFDGNNRGPAVQ